MEDSRRLPGSLEESNQAKALTVRDRISDDVSPPFPGGPSVYHLSTLHRYSVHLSDYTAGARHADLVARALLDLPLQRELEESGALDWSWAGGGRGLHAMKNPGLSCSFLDAVCVCMWGVSDSDRALGTALFKTLEQSGPAPLAPPGPAPLAPPGEWSPVGQQVTREDWWRVAGRAGPGADDRSQRLLLFALANVIRRAIIVLTGGPEGPGASSCSPRGIYVPSLWDAAECHPYPVVLGSTYPWQRFAPLVTAGSAQDGEGAPPLVLGPPGGLEDLPLHFPPGGEGGTPLSCLRAYLQLQTLSLGNRTAYAARLKGRNLPESLSLVQDYFSLANQACGRADQEVRERGDKAEHSHGDLRPQARPSSSSLSPFSPGLAGPQGHSCRQHELQRLQGRNCPPEGSPSLVAAGGDFLCGRCRWCLRETRTFNGLCFHCLRTEAETETPAPPAPPDPLQGPRPPARASPERGCLTPECVYYGSAQQAGYCTVCYCSQNETPARPMHPAPPPSSSSSSSSSSSPSPRPLQLCSTLRAFPRCLRAACDMLGNPAFQGVCERCFLAGHRGATERQAPAAWPASQRNEQGSRQYHRGPSEPDPPSTRTITAHGESRQSPSGSLGNAQALPQLHRPRPCLGTGCSNFGNSKCKGLCNSCYSSHN